MVSPALALEYEAVLKREAAETNVEPADIDDFIEYFCSRSRLVQIYFKWRPALRDPNDDRVLELAVRAQAAVVTFNVKDFSEAARFGIRIMRPSEMLALVGGFK